MHGRQTRRRRALATTAAALAAALAWAPAASAEPPEIQRPPSISGVAQVGERLEAVGARWRGQEPVRTSYVWVRCTAPALWTCDAIPGAAGPSYTPAPEDEGRRIRVWLTVADAEGEDSEVSGPTRAVAPGIVPPVTGPAPLPPPPAPLPPLPAPPAPAPPAPAPPAGERPAPLLRPFPVVRVRGYLTARGAMVRLFTVRAPRRVRVAVRCRGRGCPRERWRTRTRERLTRIRAFERELPAGVRLEIEVTRRGRIGKHSVIRFRRDRPPARTDRCLRRPGGVPFACPAG